MCKTNFNAVSNQPNKQNKSQLLLFKQENEMN